MKKSQMKKSVLILCPDPVERGGVADYYRLVRKHFQSERMELTFHYTGNSSATGVAKCRVIKFLRDLATLAGMLRAPDLVVLNPSLDPKAVLRDGIYHLLAKRIYGRSTLVFFHGWDLAFERSIARHARGLFRWVFNFDRGVVLASQFRDTLLQWGYAPGSLLVETTIYEAQQLKVEREPHSVVFLSRFEPGKGCLEAIKAIELTSASCPAVKLYMVGDGTLLPSLKEYVAARRLSEQVIFTGWLQGEEKYRLLKRCTIMLYPTCYGEGMPISLLEGMGMGLVVITRPVAGIRDIIADGENGYLIESPQPQPFAERLQYLLAHGAVAQGVAGRSRRDAETRFEIRNVARRMERIYYETAQ